MEFNLNDDVYLFDGSIGKIIRFEWNPLSDEYIHIVKKDNSDVLEYFYEKDLIRFNRKYNKVTVGDKVTFNFPDCLFSLKKYNDRIGIIVDDILTNATVKCLDDGEIIKCNKCYLEKVQPFIDISNILKRIKKNVFKKYIVLFSDIFILII